MAQPTRKRSPVIATGLAAVGGALIIIGSALSFVQGTVFNVVSPLAVYSAATVGVIFGLIVIYAAYRLFRTPTEQITWGAVIMLFSVFSLVITGGGFVVGFVLGLIGGIWAIVHGEV